MDLQEIGCDDVDWIRLANDRVMTDAFDFISTLQCSICAANIQSVSQSVSQLVMSVNKLGVQLIPLHACTSKCSLRRYKDHREAPTNPNLVSDLAVEHRTVNSRECISFWNLEDT